MSQEITRKEFLKRSLVVGGATLFSFTHFGKGKVAQAAVLDNSKVNDITKDAIYVDNTAEDDPFKSGENAGKLALAVNGLQKNFNKALTNLKNTAIAKAVGADGSTFTEVNEQLAQIKDHGVTTFTANTVDDIEVAPGYYAEGSKVEINNAEILTDPNLRSETLTVISSGTYSTSYSSTDDESVKDRVYETIEVKVDKNSGTGKEVYTEGYDDGVKDTKKGNAIAGNVLEGKTFTNSSDVEIEGTMADNSGWVKSTGENEVIAIPDGYHKNSKVTVEVTKDTETGKKIYDAGVEYADGRVNTASANYKGGYSAGQKALTDNGYVKPSGTKNITSNGTFDVKANESVKVNVSPVTNSSALGTTASWNYSSGTSSYMLKSNMLRDNNLLIVACADNSNHCGAVSPSVSSGTIKEVSSKFGSYSGSQGNVSERVQVFLWESSNDIADVTIRLTDRGNTSTSFAMLIN